MPVRIKLAQGDELLLDVNVAEWEDAFQQALVQDKMLQIEDSRGRVLTINPHQIVYLEEVPQDEAVPAHQPEAVAAY